jgi:hypothetical protein
MKKIIPQEGKQIAEESFIFAFSMLENYETMYMQAVDQNLPPFREPFSC